MSKMIGSVIDAGPGPNQFIIAPNNRIIDFDPKIPGNQGDYIYIQNDGSLGTTDTGKAAFLNIQSSIPSEMSGTVDGPEIPVGHTMKLNSQTVTFSGTGANCDISEIVSSINGSFASHSVSASTLTTSTTVTSDTSAVAYGLIGGYVPFSATINSGSGSTLINFTTSNCWASHIRYCCRYCRRYGHRYYMPRYY